MKEFGRVAYLEYRNKKRENKNMDLIPFLNEMAGGYKQNGGCPKNIKTKKRWWILPDKEYKGPHQFEITKIEPWGDIKWRKYEVYIKCKKCGARTHTFGVKETELIEEGIDLDEYLD